MPAQPRHPLLSLLGFVYWGDFAELTMYRSKRGRLVIFSKTRPDKPITQLQGDQRERLYEASQAWNALSDAERSAWEAASKKASLCMTGYNVFVYWHLTRDTGAIQTLERQTGQDLLP